FGGGRGGRGSSGGLSCGWGGRGGCGGGPAGRGRRRSRAAAAGGQRGARSPKSEQPQRVTAAHRRLPAVLRLVSHDRFSSWLQAVGPCRPRRPFDICVNMPV